MKKVPNTIIATLFLQFALLLISFSKTYAWQTVLIDSVALDGNIEMVNNPVTDDPSIVYFDHQTDSLTLATLNNGEWDIDVIKSFTNYTVSDWDACLDFHPQTNLPSVTYFDNNWNLYYAAFDGTSEWHEQVVDQNVTSVVTSFAFDHNGTAWIAYQVEEEFPPKVLIKIAKLAGTNWDISVFEENAGMVNLSINPATGYPAITYARIQSYAPPQGIPMYAYFSGATWVKQVIDSTPYGEGSVPCLDFQPGSNYPAIAVSTGPIGVDKHLKYYAWNGTKWAKITVDESGNIWGQISLAFKSTTDLPAIVYSIEDESYPFHTPLMFVQYDGSQWVEEAVEYVEDKNLIYEKSLTFDKDGNARIAYAGLKYAYMHDGSEPAGTPKWAFQTGGEVSSSPAIGPDGTIYVGSYDGNIYALSPDGSQKWAFQTGGEVSSSPAIGPDGTIYAGSSDGKFYALNPDGSQKWARSYAYAVRRSDSAIGSDGIIYVASGFGLLALNPDGVQKWASFPAEQTIWCIAISYGGTIYAGSSDGNFYALNADGSQKWSFEIDYVHSPPAIDSDGTIYIGSTDGKIYALTGEGSQKWVFPTGNHVFSSPAIGGDGTIYVGSHDRNIYALMDEGSEKWAFPTGG
jgi:outer membrane protein assembly factor BamB